MAEAAVTLESLPGASCCVDQPVFGEVSRAGGPRSHSLCSVSLKCSMVPQPVPRLQVPLGVGSSPLSTCLARRPLLTALF